MSSHKTSNISQVAVPLFVTLAALACGALAFNAWAGGGQATGAVTDQLMVYNGNRRGTDIGDFITDRNGVDEHYSYFVEVPPGLSRLVIEIFDPDILSAADPDDERDEDRDLLRTSINTYARYRLFDPDGDPAPVAFGVGGNNDSGGDIVSTPNPVAWDNAWITFYDSDRDGAVVDTTYIDNFGSVSYSNDDGTGNFAGDWIETLESGTAGPTGGIIQITGGELSISNDGAPSPFTEQPRIHREVDLSGETNAIVSFDWDNTGNLEDNDAIIFEVSDDGGTSWVGLDIFSYMSSGTGSGSATYDISDYMAVDTQVRFRIFDNFAAPGQGEAFLVDNFTISSGDSADGAAPAAGHWRVEMDMSTEVKDRISQQDELNALAVRAHDGTSGSGGTEVNMYTESYFSFGLNANDRTRNYDMYPYVTEGCTISVNDFDHDADAPDPDGVGGIDSPYGSWDLTSRSTAFTDDEGGTLSDNDEWLSEDVTGFNSDNFAVDYGIWDMEISINDFGLGQYAIYYVGNEGADDPDDNGDGTPGPSASPEANTFRMYFPTDADAAPAKPYVTHTVQYEGIGPNPPVMGSTTSFAVSLRVVNPTGSIGSVTFSDAASRTVTAQVPASTTDYEICYTGTDVGFPTSGTIISQPATTCPGTGGTIEWEPATIAAAAESQLRYGFTVEPLVATDPLTIPVTGTYGSNGTQATFLDETGDASGAFTFGPLCGLNIIAGGSATETPVLISSFEARPSGGGTLLEWKTAAEAGSTFFDIYRHGDDNRRVKLNGKPLLALLDAPQGGVYQFLDASVRADEVNTYSVVETMANGRQLQHGPYTVQVNWDLPDLLVQGDYQRTAHAVTSRSGKSLAASLAPSPEAIAAAVAASNGASSSSSLVGPNAALRVMTGQAGVHRLAASELAPFFGLNERQMNARIGKGEVQLTQNGESVAWRSVNDGAALDFYATAVDTIYSGENAYSLRLGSGLQMAAYEGRRPSPRWNEGSFRDSQRAEQNLRPLVLVALDPASDIWFWDFMRNADATHGSKDFSVPLPAVADNAATAELTVSLQGASQGTHTVDVALNGNFVGTVVVANLEAASSTLDVSQSLLLDGDNTVTLTATAGDLFFVDAFEVTYDRIYQAEDDALALRADDNRLLAPGGFSEAGIQVYDLEDPLRPQVHDSVRVIDETGSYRATWVADSPTTPYFAVSDGGVLAPLSVTVDTPSNLRATSNRGEHLILTTASLRSAAEDLARHRQGNGLDSRVIDIQDIYDEFNGGVVDLQAIYDFLAYAHGQWQVAPRYVVLAGAGTYDYRNYLGLGDNLIPPFLRSDGETLFSTDIPFVDFDDDGVPEMAIGRLPVVSAEELQSHIDKISDYEALEQPEWGSQLVLAADDPDVAEFSDVSREYSDLLSPAFQSTQIHLEDFATTEEARQALFDSLQQGALVLNYLGHGGVDRLASEGLMTIADVPNLGNDGRPTVLLAVSCHIGFHGLPGFDSLGEHMVLESSGGAIAVWAPSWLSRHNEAKFFGDRLFRQLFIAEEAILGDAILETLRGASQLGLQKSLMQTYQLLGDPALRMQLTPDHIPGGPPCEPNCSQG